AAAVEVEGDGEVALVLRGVREVGGVQGRGRREHGVAVEGLEVRARRGARLEPGEKPVAGAPGVGAVVDVGGGGHAVAREELRVALEAAGGEDDRTAGQEAAFLRRNRVDSGNAFRARGQFLQRNAA